jgi:hypothetical protein
MKKIEGKPQAWVERPEFIVKPKLPQYAGIFDLPGETCIASHKPHERINEHLHDHLYHMHIRYGFEFPRQTLTGIEKLSFLVVMMVKVEHRVDCNPIFVGRGNGNQGVCLKIAGQDVHWTPDENAAKVAEKRYNALGKKVPNGYYFAGFSTSDMTERKVYEYTREDLVRAIGNGLVADQHFQATWKKPIEKEIEPYDVTIFLGDSVTEYHTFFRLPVVVPIGAY